jgi:hypothetical protein
MAESSPSPQPAPEQNKSLRRTTVQQKPEPTPQSQPTLDVRFFSMAEGWAEQQLLMIPELEAVVIIPSWAIDIVAPCGLVKDRRGGKPHSAELLRIMQQIHRMYAAQLQRAGEMLAGYDQYAGKLADRITQLEEQLAAAQAQADPATTPK